MDSYRFHYLGPRSLWSKANHPSFVSIVWDEYYWITSIEGSGTWKAFTKLENREKNRSYFIPCWDQSRIKLITTKYAASDYIHANYVNGYQDEKKFICTQAPKSNTLNDFWRMVWSENSRIIVMLMNDLSSDSYNFCQYWPLENETLQTGRFTIQKINVKVFPSWIETKLRLGNRSGLWREIHHFCFTDWTEDAVPSDVSEYYKFVQTVNLMRTATLRTTLKLNQDPPGPIIVHCDTGIGRSGTFCAVDIALYQMMKTGMISLPEIVTDIRQQRWSSVTTCDQYLFCYRILVHFLSIVLKKSCDPIREMSE